MSGKVIAVANMKGGVGKTATVVGLAEAMAANGAKVLVLDLDPQASASICLAGDSQLAKLIEEGRTIDAYLEDRILGGERMDFSRCVADHVSGVTHRGEPLNISLLASSPYLRLLEREIIFDLKNRGFGLNAVVGRIHRLIRTQFEKATQKYDYILLDCAPGIAILTEVGVRLADLVVVPTIPDFLSSYGLQAFCQSLWTGELAGLSSLVPPKRAPYVLITRRRQTREHKAFAEALRGNSLARRLTFEIFDIEIPEAAAIAEGLGKAEHAPTFSNKWGDKIVPVWEAFASETKEVLNVARR